MAIIVNSIDLDGYTLMDTIQGQDGTVSLIIVENTPTQEWNRKAYYGAPSMDTAIRDDYGLVLR